MPGIAGIVGKATIGESEIDEMIACMAHETSYVSGTYVNATAGVRLGWVCHRGSFADCMPVWNPRGDACLVFTGEEFTHPHEIERRGRRSSGDEFEDGRYLISLYDEMGPAFVERLNGWFSGLLIDLRRQRVLLFHDRYGLCRIYYDQNTDR